MLTDGERNIIDVLTCKAVFAKIYCFIVRIPIIVIEPRKYDGYIKEETWKDWKDVKGTYEHKYEINELIDRTEKQQKYR